MLAVVDAPHSLGGEPTDLAQQLGVLRDALVAEPVATAASTRGGPEIVARLAASITALGALSNASAS